MFINQNYDINNMDQLFKLQDLQNLKNKIISLEDFVNFCKENGVKNKDFVSKLIIFLKKIKVISVDEDIIKFNYKKLDTFIKSFDYRKSDIQQLDNNIYCQKGSFYYYYNYTSKTFNFCTCPDFVKRTNGKKYLCKHLHKITENEEDKYPNDILVYHHNDLDGFASASLVLKWKNENHSKMNIEFKKVNYGDYLVVPKSYKYVFVVDFSFDDFFMNKTKEFNKEVIWCDHHESAKKKNMDLWNSNKFKGLRDLNLCGSSLTYLYLFNNGEIMNNEEFYKSKKISFVLKFCEDYDMWKFNYKKYDVFSFHEMFYLKYKSPEEFLKLFNYSKDKLYKEIKFYDSIIDFKKNIAENARYNGKYIKINKLRGWIQNDTTDPNFLSDFLLEKKEDVDFTMIYKVKNDGKVKISLRSQKDNIDLTKIASKYGGGGHKKASGMILDPKLKTHMKFIKTHIIK